MADVVHGYVTAEGSEEEGSKGFRAVKSGTGTYTLLFDNAFAGKPTVVVTITGDHNRVDNAHVRSATPGRAVVETGDYYGELSDRPFSFIAISGRPVSS
ncbi:hypothetical protein GPA10_27930 [Streptomyces sp. p1417]|uniref:Uncharacterized protein n=1 Tax=Streptomyces typhae TaxID=2681492 RepID=A0A6L6X4J2_9ACTN|nr:hypothetical protein [Streptomyces typhae]MVO88489.1 hypothetical protein [Streptomyces typhae]